MRKRSNRRWPGRAAWVLAIATAGVSMLAGEAWAQPQPQATRVAKAPAARAASALSPLMASARMSPALANRKQQRLRQHHLRGPLGTLPAARAAAPLALPAPGSQTTVSAPGPAAPGAPGDVTVLANRVLTNDETNDFTSTVSEPTVAARGDEVLLTANWFAAFSRNRGVSFTHVDPFTIFPASPQGEFCCDQVALYDANHDLMIWFLQYSSDSSGNTIRVAVAAGGDIPNQAWRYYDFTPREVGDWSNQWFDFPWLALGNDFLYISTNVFDMADQFTRTVVLRLPLADLAAYNGFDYRFFDREDVFSIRPAQGATTTMYLGAHVDAGTLRVMTWPEASNDYTFVDKEVDVWTPAHTSVAPGPDGNDWLGRSDSRLQMVFVSGTTLGFGWNAAQDANFPFPHVRSALFDTGTMNRLAQPRLWNETFAFAYPAAAPNQNGGIGISVAYGGGSSIHPSHAVGVLTGSGATWRWRLVRTAAGTDGPSDNRWGDYLSVQPDGRGDARANWVATGYALNGGSGRRNIEVRFVRFGLERAGGIAAATADPAAALAREVQSLRMDFQTLREAVEQALSRLPKP